MTEDEKFDAEHCPNCWMPKDRRAKHCRRCFRFGPDWGAYFKTDEDFLAWLENRWEPRNESR